MTDPARQKMNEEMMELYKAKGVNPASGCVPMLLTLPVLFAFYALLSQAIEMRGAPFGWLDPRPVAARSAGTSRRCSWAPRMFWQQRS